MSLIPNQSYDPVMTTSISPCALRCEYHQAPLGLERRDPRFSWQLEASALDSAQSAWQIQVTPQANGFNGSLCWDSGRVVGREQLHLAYAGTALEAHGRYLWRVKVWNEQGEESSWSNMASFAIGILDPEEWKRAKWIRHFQSNMRAVPQLRREFTVAGTIANARIYLTARGMVNLQINGQPICDHRLLPKCR